MIYAITTGVIAAAAWVLFRLKPWINDYSEVDD